MPTKGKKRIKPVIEEVVEEPSSEKETPVETVEAEAVTEPQVEEQETTPEVAPPVEEAKVEDPPVKEAKKENKMNLKLIIVITLISALVAAFVSGGVYVYLSGLESLDGGSENEIILEPEETPAASQEPTATPTAAPEVDLSDYSIQVLNGSGAIGAASGGEDVLTDAGFSVESTGNASNYNYENTVVQAKADVPESVIDSLKSALEEGDYEVDVESDLAESSSYDIVVIIGSN